MVLAVNVVPLNVKLAELVSRPPVVVYTTRPEVRPELVNELTVNAPTELAKVTAPPKYEAPAATYKAYGLVIGSALPPATGALAMYSVAALVYVVTLFVDNVGCEIL